MISIKNVTMDFKIQKDNAKSLKEFLLKVVRGKITYHRFRALSDISIEIPQGQVCGIIGQNGAGKSTLLKIIAGVFTPTQGKVEAKGYIAPMLELGAGFDLDLNARENIFLNGAILGYSKKYLESKYEDIVAFTELEDFIEQPLRTYSSGMLMRLAFAISTVVVPDILIVDEILSVGDSHFRKKSWDRMKSLMEGGTTVIMVSHDIAQIQQLCDRVIWLEKGIIKMDGITEEICEIYKNEVV